MGGIVQTQTPHSPDIFGSQRRKEHADVGDPICDVVLAEDVALDDAGLAGLADVGDASREDGVAVVGPAVPGQEADEALGSRYRVSLMNRVYQHIELEDSLRKRAC
jgi:hypothetical protein